MKQKALNALYTMNERTFNYQVWTDLILIKLHVKKKNVHEEKSQAHFSFCSKNCTNTTMHSALLECVIIRTDQS